jgi:heme/copper-type cytochrome/quinol oxidase subunit 2
MRFSFADGLFWTSVACCALAQLFILRSVGGSRHVRTAEPTTHLPRQRAGMELFWAVVPAVALTVLLLFTWRAVHVSDASVVRAVPVVEASR